jgi:hypothetical protein
VRSALAVVAIVVLFGAGLILWARGPRLLGGQEEGTAAAWIAIVVGYCIGATGLLSLFPLQFWAQQWWGLCALLFAISMGALQLGVGAMALANGYIREEGAEAEGDSPWKRRWLMLVFPTGDEVYRDQEPGSFWLSVMTCSAIGTALVLIPFLLPLFDAVKK